VGGCRYRVGYGATTVAQAPRAVTYTRYTSNLYLTVILRQGRGRFYRLAFDTEACSATRSVHR